MECGTRAAHLTAEENRQPMRMSARPAPASAEDTRCRIAVAAERLFRTFGYQKTGVADIARDLGMSPANVYRFFPSKSAINETIAERTLAELLAEADAIADGPGTAADRLTRLFTSQFEHKLRLFFDERRLHDMVAAAMEEHWGVVRTYVASKEATVARILESGMANGEFARLPLGPTARALMHACLVWQHPALIQECMSHNDADVDALRAQLGEMIGFLLRGLRP